PAGSQDAAASHPAPAAGHPAPAAGQHRLLPVAFAAGDRLIIGYFSGGALAGYQPVIRGAQPLGALILHLDRSQHLILGWANAPDDAGAPAPLVVSGTGLIPNAP
ncbi:MAG: hypothetical protein JXN59_03000, partial [Anaerolineae bacterium]|nr:hypothetical protein [Anaerolineae bacterium]